jgi:hypothetical protein
MPVICAIDVSSHQKWFVKQPSKNLKMYWKVVFFKQHNLNNLDPLLNYIQRCTLHLREILKKNDIASKSRP